jgi:hypothetical protein
VTKPVPDGFDVDLDGGFALGQGIWDVDLPVDPGEHTLTVRATGRIAWSKALALRDVDTIVVRIPELAREPPPPRAAPPQPDPAIPWLIGGAVLVGLACPTALYLPQLTDLGKSQAATDTEIVSASICGVGFVAGMALLIGEKTSSHTSSAVRVAPTFARGGGGVGLSGSF